jgi:hypothetical protein
VFRITKGLHSRTCLSRDNQISYAGSIGQMHRRAMGSLRASWKAGSGGSGTTNVLGKEDGDRECVDSTFALHCMALPTHYPEPPLNAPVHELAAAPRPRVG